MNMKYKAKKKNSAVKYRQVVLYKGGQTLVGSKSIAALTAAQWINQNQPLPVLISVRHIDSALNICHVPFQ